MRMHPPAAGSVTSQPVHDSQQGDQLVQHRTDLRLDMQMHVPTSDEGSTPQGVHEILYHVTTEQLQEGVWSMHGLQSLECHRWQLAHQACSVRKGLQRHIVLHAQLLHKTRPRP